MAAEAVADGANPVSRALRSAGVRAPVRWPPARTVWLWSTLVLTVGIVIAVAAIAPGRSASPSLGLRWLLFVAAPVHVAATGWLCTLPEVRSEARLRRVRFVWVPLGLAVVLAGTAAAIDPRSFAWLLLPFFSWQLWHFHKQNLGIVALAATSSRLPTPSRVERYPLTVAACAGIAAFVARPWLLQVGVGPRLAALFPTSAAVFVTAVAASALVYRRRGHFGYCVAYMTALLFFLPMFVFRSPYAAVGGLTVAHGVQYLMLVGMVTAGDRSTPRPDPTVAARAVVLVLIVGALLSLASHLHEAGAALRLTYGAYIGVVASHFVIDAAVWRLRDPFPRRFLASRVPYLVPGTGSESDRSVADI